MNTEKFYRMCAITTSKESILYSSIFYLFCAFSLYLSMVYTLIRHNFTEFNWFLGYSILLWGGLIIILPSIAKSEWDECCYDNPKRTTDFSGWLEF